MKTVLCVADPLPQVTRGFCPGDGFVQHVLGAWVFGAQVNVTDGCTHREPGNNHTLDKLIGVRLHQQAIGKSARVTFVGVTGYVFLRRLRVQHRLPLHPGREGRTAPAAQPGAQYFIDYVCSVHLQGAAEGLKTALLAVSVQTQGIAETRPGKCQAGLRLEPGQRFHCTNAAGMLSPLAVIQCQ